MSRYVAVGLSVLAGVALFEVALVPGVLIGGAAVLAPRYLPKLRRHRRPAPRVVARQHPKPAAALTGLPRAETPLLSLAARLGIGRAVAKTITFRVIVTTLDFTTNYVVIGQLNTAAGLSAFNLVAGPLFYLVHEAGWNYFGPAGSAVDVTALTPRGSEAKAASADRKGFTISRALAKTITYRTIATVMDFTTNYVVVGDALTAAGLSAFGFVLGPFVYLGHEKAWDYYSPPAKSTAASASPPKLLPAPA
jgi:uncharacterized membrane protein